MECVQKSVTKRKRTTDFTECAKKQGGWRGRDSEMDKQGTTTLLDEVESSRCSDADDNMVNTEVVDPEADAERDQRTVHVSGIPFEVSSEEVHIFFSSVCQVRNIELDLDLSFGVPKAVGYIEFDDSKYVSMAVDLSGQLLGGQPIEIRPLNVGNPSAGDRSHIHAGKKNFLDKPLDLMTSVERIDALTNWRELTDVENRRFFYNKLTGERSWSPPLELVVARNRAREAAKRSRVRTPVSTQHLPFSPLVPAHSQQVFGALPIAAVPHIVSQVYPLLQYPTYPLPQYPACPLPQYPACPLPQNPAYPLPQYPYMAYPCSRAICGMPLRTIPTSPLQIQIQRSSS